MTERLPPLNALRAFEVAARKGGFTGAASELNVTPAAVSHQVKSLEASLNVTLFRRLPRGLELTETGRLLLPQLSRGFHHLARAVGGIRADSLGGRLTVSAAPSFATRWLVPRLGGFLRTYPEIQVRVVASEQPLDLARGETDIRLPYGNGDYPGLHVRFLMTEEILPVCAPMVLNHAPVRRLVDLRHHTLLHDVNTDEGEPSNTWARWVRDTGVPDMDAGRGVEFSDSILLVEATLRGLGVALGRTSLVGEYLASGRLVCPLKESRASDYAYYTVTTHAGAEQARIRAFRRWVEEQVERESLGATPTV